MHPPSSDCEHASTGSAVVVPDGRQPWLDEVESPASSSLMQVLHLLPQQLDRQLRDTAGVTHSCYMILSALSGGPDRELAHSALAKAVGSSSSRVGHAVDARCARAGSRGGAASRTGACTTPGSPTKERGRWRVWRRDTPPR